MSVEFRGVLSVPAVRTASRVRAAWARTGPSGRGSAAVAAAGTVAVAIVAAPHPPDRVLLVAAGVSLLLAALVDLVDHRLPNTLVATTAALGVAVAALDGRPWASLLAGTVTGVLMLTVHLGRGIGMGDVKAAVAVGVAAPDVRTALVALAVVALLAAGTGIVRRRRQLPLGPSLWCGWVVAVLLGAAS